MTLSIDSICATYSIIFWITRPLLIILVEKTLHTCVNISTLTVCVFKYDIIFYLSVNNSCIFFPRHKHQQDISMPESLKFDFCSSFSHFPIDLAYLKLRLCKWRVFSRFIFNLTEWYRKFWPWYLHKELKYLPGEHKLLSEY